MIDWSTLTAEETVEELKNSPSVAGVWKYSIGSQNYARHAVWDPKQGFGAGHRVVSRVWNDGRAWKASYAYDEREFENVMGPFGDRFEAAAAADKVLEAKGWKVCK